MPAATEQMPRLVIRHACCRRHCHAAATATPVCRWLARPPPPASPRRLPACLFIFIFNRGCRHHACRRLQATGQTRLSRLSPPLDEGFHVYSLPHAASCMSAATGGDGLFFPGLSFGAAAFHVFQPFLFACCPAPPTCRRHYYYALSYISSPSDGLMPAFLPLRHFSYTGHLVFFTHLCLPLVASLPPHRLLFVGNSRHYAFLLLQRSHHRRRSGAVRDIFSRLCFSLRRLFCFFFCSLATGWIEQVPAALVDNTIIRLFWPSGMECQPRIDIRFFCRRLMAPSLNKSRHQISAFFFSDVIDITSSAGMDVFRLAAPPGADEEEKRRSLTV